MLSKTLSATLLAFFLSSGSALAQDQASAATDPVDSLTGLWRTESAVGSSATSAPTGKLMRVNRSSVTGFTTGACSNPTFASSKGQKNVMVTITCLGQKFATAEWSPEKPDFVMWEESDMTVTLRRVATQPAAQPATDSNGGQNGSGSGGDNAQ
jgi:hypothetical protein